MTTRRGFLQSAIALALFGGTGLSGLALARAGSYAMPADARVKADLTRHV